MESGEARSLGQRLPSATPSESSSKWVSFWLVEWQVNLQSRDRSESFDEKNSLKLPSYKGDNVNKEPDDKENNVKKQNFLLSSYKKDKGDNLACLPTMEFVLK
ncbi:hypothetical protein FCV25MIE_17365 [Fagus crenata]